MPLQCPAQGPPIATAPAACFYAPIVELNFILTR